MSEKSTRAVDVDSGIASQPSEHDLGGVRGEDSDRVLVSLSLSDPTDVVDLLDAAGQRDLNLHDVDVVDAGRRGTVPITVDLGELTETQRETLRLAFDTGYYQQPREASLEELAKALGVSKSAVSQRLNGAERKLVQSVFRTLPSTDPPE
ncbi:MAG: helix-turn-helix domain-containing protein [Haloferacaceae archaeon]